METGGYPPGVEFDSNAPWNQEDLPEKEIEVTVRILLYKTIKINVDDYKVIEDVDEDEKYLSYDFSNCDLHKAVEDQVVLPQNLAVYTERMFNQDLNLKAAGMPMYLKNAIKDCKDWCIDDYEVVPE